jgi:hypothetical protein
MLIGDSLGWTLVIVVKHKGTVDRLSKQARPGCGLYYIHITAVNDDVRLTLQIVASHL